MKEIAGMENKRWMEAEELTLHKGEIVRIHGSVYKIRKMSGFAFVLLRTARQIVQCLYEEKEASFSLEELKEECCIIAAGRVVPEERSRSGYDFHLLETEILSEPWEGSPMGGTPIVIHNKRVDTSLENLLHYRPVTLRNEQERAVFKLQEGICIGFRRFLQSQHFTEIHTPKIVAEGAEGGANIFRLDYFGKQAYLAQSPQFYKQMMVGVFERVYEIGPVFRAEKHDTARHLNEYTSVDFEMGYIESFEEIMEMETRMLKAALQYLKEEYQPELSLLKVRLPQIESIPAVRFREAKELVASEYHRQIRDHEDFEPEEEKLLCEAIKKRTGSEFVFVTHYPEKKRPFYAADCVEENNKIPVETEETANLETAAGEISCVSGRETLSFDLLFRGMEITTGGQRIHDYQKQVEKMRERGMDIEKFESYLMMHKYGMPPHGGLGLGLERFTARLLERDNVRYAALFPRDMNRVTP